MIVFKDIFSGDELFSDAFKIETVGEGLLIRIHGKRVTESNDIDDSMIGGNASAEEAAEGLDDSSVTGIDVVMKARMTEVTPFTLKQYKKLIKPYLKRVMDTRKEELARLKEEGQTEKAEQLEADLQNFKAHMPTVLEEHILKPFEEKGFQFFQLESNDDNAMIPLMYYPDGETRPYMYFFKLGMKEEKF
ncbi:translationally-controlled tumor protein homolog [Diadema antillarum]|uniref:translationally-controlled tumor protein homolog n=1 Tax=Diadema antillarum TaxID=105358 RepID=UPI003A8AD889